MNNNQNRCGCGGQPTVMDIDRETKENTNFRKEAWTGEHLQVTLMCIPTNCGIGPVAKTLYATITGIQYGRIPDRHGWIVPLHGKILPSRIA